MRAIVVVSGLLIFLGLTMVVLWGIDQDKQADWWSAWGQWVGGAGSILAAGIAVAIAYIGWRKSDKQFHQQERRQEDDRTRERASQFSMWMERNPRGQPYVTFHNASSLPFYNVKAVFVIPDANNPGSYAPGTTPGMYFIGTIPPTRSSQTHDDTQQGMSHFISTAVAKLAGPELPLVYTAAAFHPDDKEYRRTLFLHEQTHEPDRARKDRLYSEVCKSITVATIFSDGEFEWKRRASGRLELIGPQS